MKREGGYAAVGGRHIDEQPVDTIAMPRIE